MWLSRACIGEASHPGAAVGSNDFVCGADLVIGMDWNMAPTFIAAGPAAALVASLAIDHPPSLAVQLSTSYSTRQPVAFHTVH